MNKIIDDVKQFTKAVGCTTDQFNLEQTGLYIGLVAEEMKEVLQEIYDNKYVLNPLEECAIKFKKGFWNEEIEKADKVKLAHELCDMIWVATGALLSMGVDVDGAMAELAMANMSKLHKCDNCSVKGHYEKFNDDTLVYDNYDCFTCEGTGYICKKDENGKVVKPDSFVKADMTRFVCKS